MKQSSVLLIARKLRFESSCLSLRMPLYPHPFALCMKVLNVLTKKESQAKICISFHAKSEIKSLSLLDTAVCSSNLDSHQLQYALQN